MAGHIKQNWIQDCLDEISFPGSPWYDVKELISRYIVDVIRIEGFNTEQIEKIRYYLGTNFISQYQVYGANENVSVAKAVRPLPDDKVIEEKCKQILQDAVKYAKCDINMALTKSPHCFQNLVNLISNIFEASLKNQVEYNRQSHFISHEKNSFILAMKPFCDKETELLGEALITILQKEPSRLDGMLLSLQGRLLPMTLRSVVYRLILIRMFKIKYVENNKEYTKKNTTEDTPSNQFLRELFVKNVKRGMEQHKLKKATSSPIKQLIQNTVVQTFENLSGLKQHAVNVETQKECCKVLNVYYTANNQFESFFVLRLIPFQIAIRKEIFAPEHIYELSMWLDCFSTYIFPISIEVVNALVLKIWKNVLAKPVFQDMIELLESLGISCTIEKLEPILVSHASYSSDLDTKDLNTSSSQVSLASSTASKSNAYFIANHHIVLCIRRWIVSLFVGFTNIPVSMFLFDQLFMEKFSSDCIHKCCIVLLKEMKVEILRCSSTEEICLTLLEKLSDVTIEKLYRVWNLEM